MLDSTKPFPVVYVVDDERAISQTLALILNNHGFCAISFTEPTVALQAARAISPDLVVSDVMMPEMDGFELAIYLKATLPSCKMLLFSGHGGTKELLHSAEQQGHDFNILAKPFHPLELLAAIARL